VGRHVVGRDEIWVISTRVRRGWPRAIGAVANPRRDRRAVDGALAGGGADWAASAHFSVAWMRAGMP
jgi:hypothetical protein